MYLLYRDQHGAHSEALFDVRIGDFAVKKRRYVLL